MVNREIKFRVWKPESKRMDYLRAEGYMGGYGIYDPFIGCDEPDKAWMQFTGLLDKNDKEIYEGDICEVINFYSEMCIEAGEWVETLNDTTGVIEFKEGCFMFNDGQDIPLHYFRIQQLEIIGNIYENPELLK